MKIGILQTGRAADTLRDKHGDFPDMMQDMLSKGGFAFQTYPVLDGVFPQDVHACDGWLITGSRHSAYEDLPWIAELEKFLRGAYAAEVPIVGICFGHQVLAQALGGKVEKFPMGWGVGPTTYDFADGRQEVMNAWHQDQIMVRPADATVVASNAFCANAALAYGTRAISFQAHPEFTRDFARDLLELRRDLLEPAVLSAARVACDTLTPSDKIADQIVRFFQRSAIEAAQKD
jgi:GMP synthase-like glutamine amidotransferase